MIPGPEVHLMAPVSGDIPLTLDLLGYGQDGLCTLLPDPTVLHHP